MAVKRNVCILYSLWDLGFRIHEYEGWGLKSCRMWCHVVGWVDPDVRKASVSGVKELKTLGEVKILLRLLDSWRWRHCGPLVCQEPLIQRGITPQKAWILSSITVKTSNSLWVCTLLSSWLWQHIVWWSGTCFCGSYCTLCSQIQNI
jgi:hypothetical protein